MKIVSLILALAAATATVAGQNQANASPYVATLEEVGSNVVASGNGQIDLTGLTLYFPDWPSSGSTGFVQPNPAAIALGDGNFDIYSGGISGPSNYGSAGQEAATYVTLGGTVGLDYASGWLFVPTGYVSDTALAETNVFENQTLASLGLTPGTYVWTWGSGADQSFTLDIVATPLPAALPLFATGLAALGLFGWRRKWKALAVAV